MNTLIIKDETAVGKLLHEIELQFKEDSITVEALIRKRVEQEVKSYNDLGNANRLVQPTEFEEKLNKTQTKNTKNKIDVEKQIYVALDAFQQNRFFILVGNEQVDQLDAPIIVSKDTDISFVKLTPLVGG